MLRGINVSGRRPVKMASLQEVCTSLGFADVETYLQSGNIVLRTDRPQQSLPEVLSKAIAASFGHDDVHVVVLSATELRRIVDANVFIERGCDPAKLHVTFFAGAFDDAVLPSLPRNAYLPDEFEGGNKVVYLHCPNGYGRTKLNNAFFERKMKRVATTRNWSTTLKLRDLTSTR
jgi:uncharacterized protein (DUF1697 family)